MTPERFARVKEVFLAACEQTGAAREPVLTRLCGDDESLKRDVLAMLAAHDQTHGVFTAPASIGDEIEVPREIAGFTIIDVLGAGGMGVVYRARQQHPAREVALKVLRSGMLSAGARKRFVLEAEVLGRLHHSAIAQVYQAGEWQHGGASHPYFAMELVEGRQLDEHASSLSTRAKIEVMTRICDAVDYAHRSGVIHRDLKPGNILVASSGDPKILDFGVARATDSDIRVTTQRTDMGQLMGTVAYMSPEQASGDPTAIDQRSDIYSLGVILYELLAGELPLDMKLKSLPQAVRSICDDDPTPLSTFNRTFRGDLQTIVAKAMEKDRDRRYQSAGDLAAELRHYLNEEPIAARPASTLYQLKKFSRRNKGLVAGLALAMLMLAAGTAASTVFAIRAERRSAQLALAVKRLEASNKFLTDTLEAANPEINRLDLSKPRDVRVIDVLDYAASKLASTYGDQPEVEISVRATLGETYVQVEQSDQGREQYQLAYDLARRELGEDHPETLRLGVRSASLMRLQADAESALRPLFDRCEHVNGVEHPDTIAALNSLVASLYFQRNYLEARPLAEEAVSRARRALDNGHNERLVALNNLAFLLNDIGESDQAELLFREVMNDSVSAFGDKHPETIRSRRNLVNALRALGRHDDAIAMMRQVVEDQSAMFGEDSRTTLFSRNNLAVLVADAGDQESAGQMLEQVVDAYSRGGELESSAGLLAKHNLAKNLFRRGQVERSLILAKETHDARVRVFGHDTLEVAISQRLLAQILTTQSEHEQASPLYRSAISSLVRIRGEDHPQTIAARLDFARSLIAGVQYQEAERHLLACHESSKRVNGENHAKTAQCARDVADLYEQWGRSADARIWRSQVSETRPE